MCLAAAMAASAATARPAPRPSATLRVVPGWTYQGGGKLAVIVGCSQRGDARVISSKMLPRSIRMRKGRNLLIKVTGKTKPGKYKIVLLCEEKHKQPDSVDVKTVRIYKILRAFQQPDQPLLPSHFKPDVTVSSGPPPAAHHKKKHHKKHTKRGTSREASGSPRVARTLLVLSRATRGPSPSTPSQSLRLPPAPARGGRRERLSVTRRRYRVDAQPTAAAAGTIDVGGDLTVNRLGFGAMRITGPGIWGDPPSRDQAIATLRRVVELGINFIDTADSYGPEVSETLIAEALHPYPDDLVIATKGGLIRPGPNRWEADGRPAHLREACEGSLRRLRLEQIPLYQFHRPDPAVPLADSIGTIAELKTEGKIRHVGISNVSESQLREAQQIVSIVSVQNRYNAADRRSESLIDLCEQEQLAFLPWAPVQESDKNPAVAAAARRHGVTQYQVVLAWLLAMSPQILPIPGTGSVGHAEENIAAASVELTPDEVEAIGKGALPARSRTMIPGWFRRHRCWLS